MFGIQLIRLPLSIINIHLFTNTQLKDMDLCTNTNYDSTTCILKIIVYMSQFQLQEISSKYIQL